MIRVDFCSKNPVLQPLMHCCASACPSCLWSTHCLLLCLEHFQVAGAPLVGRGQTLVVWWSGRKEHLQRVRGDILCPWLTMWIKPSPFSSLGLGFLTYKIGILECIISNVSSSSIYVVSSIWGFVFCVKSAKGICCVRVYLAEQN